MDQTAAMTDEQRKREMWRRAHELPIHIQVCGPAFGFRRGDTWFLLTTLAEAMRVAHSRLRQEGVPGV